MVQGALALSKYATPETAADGAGTAVQSGYYLALGAAGALFRCMLQLTIMALGLEAIRIMG